MPITLSYDESGNSGGNLLDPAQPVYVLGATRLSDEGAAELLASHGLDRGKEAHFKNLRRKTSGQQRVLGLLADLPADLVLASVTHKRFMIVAKIVDDLVETVMHDDGFNLYEGGGHLALTNLLYHTLPVFHPAEFEEWLERFVDMARKPTHKHIENFFAACRRLRQATDHESNATVFRMIESLRDDVVGLLPRDYPLDPCLTAFVALTSSWESRRGLDSEVVAVNYDETPVMKAQQQMLATLCDQTRTPTTIGAGERSIRLPLPVNPLRFVPSENHPAIQVMDLVASSVAYWIRAGREDAETTDFHESLRDLTHGFVTHAVWPDTDAIGQRDESYTDADPATDAARWLFQKS